MISLNDLYDEIQADTKIDRTQIENEILRTPKLMHKYLKYHHDYKMSLGLGETKLNNLIRNKMRFYQGKGTSDEYRHNPFNDVCTNQKDLERYILADKDICQLKEKINEFETTSNLLFEMIQSLKYRNNSLASIIELRKFESGV